MSPLRAGLSLVIVLALAALCPTASAQKKNDQLPPRGESEILKTLKLPEGYEATVFAPPPMGGYPTSVSAAIDGTIFVAIDENGSLGRDRNPGAQTSSLPSTGETAVDPTAGKAMPRVPGRVVRMRDTDGDGRADEFKTFAAMESPRGVIWDGPGMGADGKMSGTLYVMHPPNLTAYTDTDGDGTADQQADILTGLGFGLDFRGADLTTNGCRLAIDGFIYIAVGDYGFINARAKDGTELTNRGGGIVRVRPDGTGFEIISRGQRNIYDVAISPTLDLFTCDNTNDGGGWNVRLSHVPPGAQMGYPTLFKNFPEDIVPPLADFGGGSPCGALWIDEPGLPSGLFTVEWGSNAIMHHPLKQKGAGWELERASATDPKLPGQVKWLGITRPTDMDVDAAGRLYITSWEGATFTYNGPNAGYVVRVAKKDAPKVEVPDVTILGASITQMDSPSAKMRLAAQRHLLRQGASWTDARVTEGIGLTLAAQIYSSHCFSGGHGAVTMLRTLAQIRWNGTIGVCKKLCELEGGMEEFALQTMEEEAHRVGDVSLKPFFEGLKQRPRVRAAAITALRRLGKADAAPHLLPLVAEEDPIISHLAVSALSELKASQVCLAALDSTDEKVKPGALQALYGIYDPAVVDGLIARLGSAPVPGAGRGVPPRRTSGDNANPSATATPGMSQEIRVGETPTPARGTRALPGTATADAPFDLRRGIFSALCRLANQDEPYTDPKVWWGTRPDTSGPVYKPIAWSETPKIEAALKTALDASSDEEASWLVQRMYLAKVNFPGLIDLMLAKAGGDTATKLTAIEGMFRADNSLPEEASAVLKTIALSEKEAPDFRAKALRQLARGSNHGSVFPVAVEAFAALAGHPEIAGGQPALAAIFEDFTRDAKNSKWLGEWARMAAAPRLGRPASSPVGEDGRPARAAERQPGSLAAGSGETPDFHTLAQTVLVNLATSALVKGKDKDAAEAAVEKSWAQPESAASLLGVIARTGAKAYAGPVKARLKDPNNAVAEAALFAFQKLGLSETAGAPAATIASLPYEVVFAAVQKGGNAEAGKELYLRAGCIACHTVTSDEPPKGPVLSAVAKIYDRAALTESILKPNAKLAQGFESAFFKTKKGEQIEGFVTREGGDSLDVRNLVGQTVTLEKGDIAERGHRELSMMPEGLMNAFTPAELASVLAWIESLRN